jgi:predicted Ser/Thr protein kinase
MEPHRLGRYVIERLLGRGAMGVVYLARDPVIGRRVALKTLKPPDDAEEAEEFRQRFLREAQAAGILNHPGIVTVHDAGVDEGTGLSYIAMEFIEGKSLRELVKSGHSFAFSDIARIGAALASGLDYAHSKGVVHRDIKPANIILTPQGSAKITDFGVARLESSNITTAGQFIGTPNYMSPEQVTGAKVDGRSDLFSLGVVLFELLAGNRPFVGASLTEVTYKIVHDPAPIPSQIRPGVPPAFNPIILKMLEKNPEQRYARGADVARGLDVLRRILLGVGGDSTQLTMATTAVASVADTTSMTGGPTATRVTAVERAEPAQPSIWKLPITPKWVAVMLAAVAIPPAVAISLLSASVDRGPYPGPGAGEPGRRHAVVAAQRGASTALQAGNPGEAERLLATVWDQAPYSPVARRLRVEAARLRDEQAATLARNSSAQRLLNEGKELLREGNWRAAQARFEGVLEIVPDDPLAREYLDLARERARLPRAQSERPTVGFATPAPSTAAVGEARLEIYFNSPLSAGTIEVEENGNPVLLKPFDFSTKGFLGVRRRGTGVFQDTVTVPAGTRTITVRLRDAEGALLGEEAIPATIPGGGRYVLKIEMDSERAVPRFGLTTLRERS